MTTGDFGVAGELPSHPELLDWLAVEFRESGWDVKRFFKLMVMSATYRQAAISDAGETGEGSGESSCCRAGRGSAWMPRWSAIMPWQPAACCRTKIGGPSVRPYQPPGVWEAVAMIGSNTRDYRQDQGENLYRRSLYTFWKRSAPPASMDIFNAPSRESCTVRRERTNTPLQALVTLNDPQFVEAARVLAEQAMREGGRVRSRRRTSSPCGCWRGRCRTASRWWSRVTSLAIAGATTSNTPEDAQQLVSVGESPPDSTLDSATLAAWTMLANELMNLDEVLNK